MARNRKKQESLVYQVQKTLEAKLAIGDSKANDKAIEALRLREKRSIIRKLHYLMRNASRYIKSIAGKRSVTINITVVPS